MDNPTNKTIDPWHDDEDRYNDDDIDWDLVAMDEEEAEFEKRCEQVYACTCGALQFNSKHEPVRVADCCCGAE